jgi:hypothetical protein
MSSRDERVLRRRIAGVSLVLGLILAITGLSLGLRGAPPGTSVAPVVVAALILARALVGLGMMGLGVSLTRFGWALLFKEG